MTSPNAETKTTITGAIGFMEDTLEEYRISADLIYKRIQELSRTITEAENSDSKALTPLVRRRYLLYSELWDLNGAISQMEAYVSAQKKARK